MAFCDVMTRSMAYIYEAPQTKLCRPSQGTANELHDATSKKN